MIFVGIIIGLMIGCGLWFAVAMRPEYRHRRVRYLRAKPMLPRKWDTEE